MAGKQSQDVEKGELGPGISEYGTEASFSENRSHSVASGRSSASIKTLISHLVSMKLSMFKPRSPDANSIAEETQTAESQDNGLVIRQVHKAVNGYPRLATFLDSEDQFSIYRRFGYLASRLLLERQDDLRQLEDKLGNLDKDAEKQQPGCLQTRLRLEDEEPSKQHVLLGEIEEKFSKYCELLCHARELAGFNKPSHREHESVQNWINNANPLHCKEQRFINWKEDLITLRRGREHAWLDSAIELIIRYLDCRLITWLFRSKEAAEKSDGKCGECYFTRSRIELAANTLITFMILALLVVPVYFLFYLTNKENKEAAQANAGGAGSANQPLYHTNDRINTICIGILLVSTLAFSATISLFTNARRHEILGASAAYCATLVVFIGNLSNGAGILQ